MFTWTRKTEEQVAAGRPFDSIGTLQAHLDFKGQLEDYIEGRLQEPLASATTCHAGCLLGKWLHAEGGNCADVDLVDSACRSCEDFQEAATNAVLLKDMGDVEMARAALREGEALADASDRFQLSLARLHQRYSASAKSRLV